MPQCGLHMNNVSFLKQWGKKYGIGIIVGLLMSVGFLVMDADRWIGMHTLNQKTAKYTVVIDSGHGGVDPGKIGVDGVYEKDINLAIAKQLQKVLERNDCQHYERVRCGCCCQYSSKQLYRCDVERGAGVLPGNL